MKISLTNKKVVVYDTIGPHSRENLCFDRNVAKEEWANYSSVYLYEECLKNGIQLITSDIYFALPKKPKAICVRERDDADLKTSLALQKEGVKLAIIRSSENPLYACQFYWNLTWLTSHFDHSVVMRGVKSWVSKKSQFHPQYTPHGYYTHVRQVAPGFGSKKFLVMIQKNTRVHWLHRLYVNVMNVIKPMPTFTNREGYLDRLKAIRYFSQYDDFDLYGRGWNTPVRYTQAYDASIKKSYRGSPDDKYETLKQYRFSLVLENSYLGGYVQYMKDSLYAGAVPIYWGAPDITDIFPPACFIDFRKFDCDFAKLDHYLRNMDESEYNEYIGNINKWIASPEGGYAISQEKFVGEMIQLFNSYF
ncbi:MAG: glycosyltransferase family 10 [Patescibacteria group bacterium]